MQLQSRYRQASDSEDVAGGRRGRKPCVGSPPSSATVLARREGPQLGQVDRVGVVDHDVEQARRLHGLVHDYCIEPSSRTSPPRLAADPAAGGAGEIR